MSDPNPDRTSGSDEAYRELVEQAEDGIFIADPHGTYVQVNPSGHRLLGYDPAELLGKRIIDIVRAEDVPRLQAVIRDLEHGLVYTQEWTLVRKDGSLLDAEIATQKMSNGLFLGVVRDRGRRRSQEASHREIVERLQKIASQVPGVVYQFKLRPDGSSCFPYASERIREIYRVSPEEVREDASKVFAILHPDDYAAVVASITSSAESMQPWKFEYRVKFPDGHVRWLYGNSVPERQDDGAILWHGFITDVTDRKEVEAAKAHLEEQLQQSQKVESIGRLAGGVAHDFNNMLTSILGFSELALGELPKDSLAAGYIASVVESAQRGAVLTQQLLAFARKKIVNPRPTDLNEILTRLTPLLRQLVGEHIDLTLDLSSDRSTVMVDIGGIEQVIVNLAVNARDAMPLGGRVILQTGRVVLDGDYARAHAEVAPGEYVTLAVTDTGTGMTPEVQARMFEPFFTTKPMGQGTGLGLATCHGIVKQAGGHVSVFSEAGAGTTFTVHLPGLDAPPRPAPPVSRQASNQHGNETVLLVEDEAMILDVARKSLVKLGYDVLTATGGLSALELVSRHQAPIHLLVTDVVMPKMGGKELAARMEALRPGIKVLYTSGHAEDAIVHHGVLDKGLNFLQKPYTPSSLTKQVREVLDG